MTTSPDPRFRLSKLGALLESRNRTLRAEAVTTLANLANGSPSPETITQLFSLVAQYSQSTNWDGRVAASELLAALLANSRAQFGAELAKLTKSEQQLAECTQAIQALSVREVIECYRTLVSSKEPSAMDCSSQSTLTSSQRRQQRQLVDQYLEMNSSTGVSSQAFITDEELSNNSQSQQGSQHFQYNAENGKMELKREMDMLTTTDSSSSLPAAPIIKKEEEQQEIEEQQQKLALFRHFHTQLINSLAKHRLLIGLVHPQWQHRHGAALALAKLCAHANTWLLSSPSLLSRIAIALLQLLTLDRFNDFVTGSNAVAPVREAAAQALTALLLALEGRGNGQAEIAEAILGQVGQLLAISDETNWQCRQTALLVIKYHFAVSKFQLPAEQTLFNATIKALGSDPVDEVVSSATQALCSLFENPNVNEEAVKKPLIERVMEAAWALMGCERRMVQFREGVDSVLVDLLTMLSFWLRVSPSAHLGDQRFLQVLALFDCNQPTRTARALECIWAAMQEQRRRAASPKTEEDGECGSAAMTLDWSGETLFILVKQLYRCVLFTQHSAPSGSSTLAQCQLALDTLLWLIRNRSIPDQSRDVLMAGLAHNIGFWMCCLIYEHRSAEIDVFVHRVDGPTSRPENPRENLCGDELRFLTPSQCDEILVERKVLAARFLASLFHTLFRNNHPPPSADVQPISVSIQLLLVPYLRSNSLYQKLGAALVANAWAMHQHAASEGGDEHQNGPKTAANNGTADRPPEAPQILVAELSQQLCSASSNAKLYDEASHMVNSLSNECNEFQQYCVRKGVPREELIPLAQASSMEEVILSTFRNCERRLKRADDRQALNARHAVITELIASTKMAIRTYANRINALLSSSLFHCSNRVPLPAQLTPLIKPLVEALDSEVSPVLAESLLGPAFLTLLRATTRREPCPHAKVLRQLCLGLGQCDDVNATPKPAQWTAPEHSWRVLSMDMLDPEGQQQNQQSSLTTSSSTSSMVKARNCALVLRHICRAFGDRISDQCPELINGQCCSMDTVSRTLTETEQWPPNSDKELESALLQLDSLRTVFPTLSPPELRRRIIRERVRSVAERLFALLAHQNPAVRFRTSRFLADIAALELCAILKMCYGPLNKMISGPLADSTSARCGAVELLARLASIGAPALLGAVSLLAPLALRAIGDQQEQVRQAASYAFRQLVTLLPLENRSQHFLSELIQPDDDADDAGPGHVLKLHPGPQEDEGQSAAGRDSNSELSRDYESTFALVDVLCAPGNLPRICSTPGDRMPWLRTDVQLRDYQLEGITWLSFLHRFGLNGILADDMGLGKTVQVLCLLAWDKAQRSHNQSSLIVCPRTLIDHWCNEWRNFFPSATIPILKLPDYKQLEKADDGREAILVISYEELRANRSSLGGDRAHGRWNYLVLDEGHCIRNAQSQLFECCCALRASHRLILSGTPVQNSPADLWALFQFLMPGYLSTRAQFQARFMRHIQACRNPRATEQQCKKGEQALQLLHRQCLPFVMRRLKSEVLAELPDKIVQDQPCELGSLQRELYQLVVDRCSMQKHPQKQEESVSSSADPWLSPLQALHMLRKLVDHPSLISAELAKHRLLSVAGAESERRIGAELGQLSLEQSGKMVALRELLTQCQIGDRTQMPTCSGSTDTPLAEDNAPAAEEIAALPDTSSHRALVFCQWRATVELIIHFLGRGAFGPDISWLRLDASVPAKERQCVVDRFNADPSIDLLLLTTHIGGVGLNLTGADVVIFVDHDWNPFRDLQAIDRAHRLGQRRTVNVYRLITRGTVEDKVMRLQRFKADTANALVGADNRSLAGMATDELLELFTLGDNGGGERSKGQKAAKRAKMAPPEAQQQQWGLEELWGTTEEDGHRGAEEEQTEQYRQLHSVATFIRSSAGTKQ